VFSGLERDCSNTKKSQKIKQKELFEREEKNKKTPAIDFFGLWLAIIQLLLLQRS